MKQLIRYLIVGCGAVGVDALSYAVLSKGMDPNLAKGISFLLGGLWSFLGNKWWTFQVKQDTSKQMGKFILLYGTSFLANYLIHLVLFEGTGQKVIAFVMATGFSVVWNYVGQRWWVFRKKGES